MMITDDIVRARSRLRKIQRWRYALEKRGMEVSQSETEHRRHRLQGVETKKGMRGRGEEACATRLEQVEKSVGRDV